MRSAWRDDEQGRQKKQDSWKPSTPRMSRHRRPLLLAFCAITLILLWHYGAPSQNHPSQEYDVSLPLPRRPQLEYNSKDAGDAANLPSKGKKQANSPLDIEGHFLLGKRGHEYLHVKASKNDDSFQPEQKPNEEHSKEDDEVEVVYEEEISNEGVESGHGETSEHVEASEQVEASAEEEHNPDHNSDSQNNENAAEKKAQVPLKVVEDGKEQAAFQPSADSSKFEKPVEKEPEDHLSLEEKAESLPEIIHVPFEDAVSDMKIEGWEDDWVAQASFNVKKWNKLQEPKIDFVYLWVNGSDQAFQDTKHPYELNSVLNDKDGIWINSHGVNRYRDWDELRYSLRSLEKHAAGFRNKIQILVNSVVGTAARKQVPTWLNDEPLTKDVVQVLAQEEFFDSEKHVCLPTFNSLTIENQIFNTPSDTDSLFALSDDMLLGRPHAPSDINSPLFGPVMGFKSNAYSTVNPPTDTDAHRFGEKPFLIYTSWLLNRRFGVRKRAGQGHFGHSLSRTVTREAIGSFPGPELQSACKRFRGEPGFQLYSWYATFHYLIERHREALLWSYIMLRSDTDNNGNLGWEERQTIMSELKAGMKNEGRSTFRKRNFYHVAQLLERAGLEPPKVNTDIQWTSLDGPAAIRGIDCSEFDVNECLAPGFSSPMSDSRTQNPVFSSNVIFDRVSRQTPKCGDCLLKLILNQRARGLSPLLPHAKTQAEKREIVVKAVMRYRYTIIQPDALFVMVTDAEQVDSTLVNRFVRQNKPLAGQLCLNDDVSTENEQELRDVMQAMTELYDGLFPEKSPFEK